MRELETSSDIDEEVLKFEKIDQLFKLAMKKKWKEVMEIYQEHPNIAHKAIFAKSKETLLHIVISSYHYKSPSSQSDAKFVEGLIDITNENGSLEMKNVRGDTPLHLAAAAGWSEICNFIALKDQNLISIRNEKGETPLFTAALHGNLQAFLCLHERCNNKTEPDYSFCRRKDGDTILHSAISGEYFDLAFQIISYYKNLVNYINEDGESPLHVLAKKPNVFRSSGHLRLSDSIIYHCVFVDRLKRQKCDPLAIRPSPKISINLPANYRTCVDIFALLWFPFSIITSLIAECTRFYKGYNKQNGGKNDVEKQRQEEKCGDESLLTQQQSAKAHPTREKAETSTEPDEEKKRNSSLGGNFPPNCSTCVRLFKFAMKIILIILGGGFGKIRKIITKKEQHCHAMEVMNEMINHDLTYNFIYDSNGQRPADNLQLEPLLPADTFANEPPHWVEKEGNQFNVGKTSSPKAQNKNETKRDQNKSEENTPNGLVKKDTPLLAASKTGIFEMVKKIIKKHPVALQDLDAKGKNVLMLAAEYRQTALFDYLLMRNLPGYIFHQVDDEENNILHLAAKLGNLRPWRLPGAALQIQWEMKWYKYVKRSLSPLSFDYPNVWGKTPWTILTETHKELKKAANEWLIITSESCSVVAALVAAVAFATAATVPGGLNQEKGYPILRYHKAFDVFSIASLVALCLSVTALVFFLAIITSQREERDFKSNLPKKLLMGLTSLFSSIVAMLLSFCAGHTFILREELKIAALPIYASAIIPLFAIAQLPLYFDLLWATYNKAPLRSYKVFYQ